MPYEIIKKIEFSYAHRLLNYEGKCAYLHGHNAIAEIILKGNELDDRGLLIDFYDIKNKVKKWIDEHFDHQCILHVQDPLVAVLKEHEQKIFLTEENPSAEHLAKIIFEQIQQMGWPIAQVRVWESPSSCASYSHSIS